MLLRYQIKTIIFSDNFILITIPCDSYKRRKTLMKEICQRFIKSTNRKRQQMCRNSYFQLLRQRHRSSSLHNSLIKSIVSKVYLPRKIDSKNQWNDQRIFRITIVYVNLEFFDLHRILFFFDWNFFNCRERCCTHVSLDTVQRIFNFN